MLQDMLAVAFQRAPCGLMLTDTRGQVLLANDAAATMFGYTLNGLSELNVDQLVPVRFQGTHAKQRTEFFTDPEHRTMGTGRNLVGLRTDGTEFPVEVGLSPVKHEGEQFVLCSVVDITRRYNAERAKAALEENTHSSRKLESLGILASGIAHDFGSLLMGVSGSVDLAIEDLPEGSPALPRLVLAKGIAKQMGSLINQMLAFAGHGSQVLYAVDLNLLLQEVAQLLEVATHHRASLVFELRPDLPCVQADESQIRQVLLSLVRNAVEALPAGERGVVSITTLCRDMGEPEPGAEVRGPCVMITISDTGTGIREEDLGHIFDPLFTTKPESHGLGLAGVRGIVAAHGGTIQVSSEFGSGTTVSLTFPVDTVPSEGEATVRTQHASSDG